MQNDSTNALEAKARARGLNLVIRQMGTKYKPSYCVMKRDGVELSPPMQIGTSIREAEEWLETNRAHQSKYDGRAFTHLQKRTRKPMKLL